MLKKFIKLLGILGVLGVFGVFPVFAQGTTGKITLEPSKESISAGEALKITVNVDTGEGNEVNSYQAILDYPEDKLEFVSINTDNSPFNMDLVAKGENGRVEIVRGSTKALTGKMFSALVTFKAKTDIEANEVSVSNESAIIRSADNTNILEGSVIQNEKVKPSVAQAGNNELGSFDIEKFFGWVTSWFFSLFK